MFDLTFVIILFSILMVLSVIFFFISRMVFRIITITTTILLIFMLVIGVLVIQDAQSLNTELARGPTSYILSQNETAIAGFIVYVTTEDTDPFGTELLDELIENPLPMNSTNAFTINIRAFENHTLPESDSFPSYLTMDSVLEILKSDNPFNEYVELAIQNDPYYQTVEPETAKSILLEELNTIYSSDPVLMKSDLFMLLVSRVLSTEGEGSSFIFLEAKRGNIKLYPQRLTMRLINIVPERLIQKTVEAT